MVFDGGRLDDLRAGKKRVNRKSLLRWVGFRMSLCLETCFSVNPNVLSSVCAAPHLERLFLSRRPPVR